MIRFEEEGHRYFDGERELLSVSALMRKHGLAPDYAGIPEGILRAKAERGTLIHKEIEDYIKTGDIGFTREVSEFARWIKYSGITVQESEYIVHNDIVAGTIDLLLIDAEGNHIIADIKTTAAIKYDAVAWQLSIYNNLAGYGAARFLVVHFDDLGAIDIKEINPKKDEEVERLFDAERNGKMFFPQTPAILDDMKIAELAEIERVIADAKRMKEDAEAREKEIKDAIIKAMEDNGIKTFECDTMRITYVAPSESKTVDAARIKKEMPEIAAQYEKIVRKQASLRITVKDGGESNE